MIGITVGEARDQEEKKKKDTRNYSYRTGLSRDLDCGVYW